METKTCTRCGVTAPLDRFNRKKSGKHGRSAECKSCSTARYMKWARENPEAAKDNVANWTARNPERKKQKDREWRENNAARYKHTLQQWHKANPRDRSEYKKRWYEDNKHRYRGYNASRRAALFNACPSWVDQYELVLVYHEAVRLTRETGLPHEVDHIVPLQHDNVCGLHVPWNLQVITKSANREKSNRHE